MNTTILRLWGIGVPPYSARGIVQTLEPIDAASNIARTINGKLLDMSHDQFKKFKSTLTATDQRPPAVDGVWPGQLVTVDCIQMLAHMEYTSPSREYVPGSEITEAGWNYYRPRLHMMVMNFTLNTDEYPADVGWTMELEERG